ncbi:6-phosphogluconolactonase [Gracilibacillus halotolerans]|uniref:6-phosphogluconolactonase n=1 Tax=Gracilibacillus halotolerans TaxID=74386 RepID=A0A841RI38_9BACI|nr:lactonase family protein [Gracilibacillus halotolerans]MBB6513860.1 6-phosphogluconolactonase [Gracilibacillus halotolerans]
MAERNGKYRILVGSYGSEEDEAIQLLEWDATSKEMRKVKGVNGIDAPSYLTYDSVKKVCYAISETVDGLVISYQVGEELVEISRRSTGDNGPCYVSKDSSGDFLFITNYGGGSLSLHPLDTNGGIKEYSDRISFYHDGAVGKVSHPHICYPLGDSGIYIVADLGKDKLYLFELDRINKKLRLINTIDVTKGSGPRHVEYHEAKSILYVANEFSSTVSVFRFNEESEELEPIQEINALSAQQAKVNYSADIHLSPNGDFLYVSNRGDNVITSFQVMEDGTLVCSDDTSVLGEWPRNFVITPDGKFLLVANEHTDNITVFSIDEAGNLYFENVSYSVYQPTCLCVMNG